MVPVGRADVTAAPEPQQQTTAEPPKVAALYSASAHRSQGAYSQAEPCAPSPPCKPVSDGSSMQAGCTAGMAEQAAQGCGTGKEEEEDETAPGQHEARPVSSGHAHRPVEVFLGGLPPGALDYDVFLALANAGEVLSVKVFRRKGHGECKGYARAFMASQLDAARAVREVKQACGCTAAVSIPSACNVAQRDAEVEKGGVVLQRVEASSGVPGAESSAGAGAGAGRELGGTPASLGTCEGGVAPRDGGGEAGEKAAGSVAVEECDRGEVGHPQQPLPGSMALLLHTVRQHGDRKAELTSAALTSLLALPRRPKLAFPPSRPYRPPIKPAAAEAAAQRPRPARCALSTPESAALGRGGGAQDGTAISASYLDAHPRCLALMGKVGGRQGAPPRTPLQVVHEYAARLALEVLYDERSFSPLGPFTLEVKLTGKGGQPTLASGAGEGRSKQQAKQVAGAALLETLLASVPESDFFAPGAGRQPQERGVPPAAAPMWGVVGRGGLAPAGVPVGGSAPPAPPGGGGGGRRRTGEDSPEAGMFLLEYDASQQGAGGGSGRRSGGQRGGALGGGQQYMQQYNFQPGGTNPRPPLHTLPRAMPAGLPTNPASATAPQQPQRTQLSSPAPSHALLTGMGSKGPGGATPAAGATWHLPAPRDPRAAAAAAARGGQGAWGGGGRGSSGAVSLQQPQHWQQHPLAPARGGAAWGGLPGGMGIGATSLGGATPGPMRSAVHPALPEGGPGVAATGAVGGAGSGGRTPGMGLHQTEGGWGGEGQGGVAAGAARWLDAGIPVGGYGGCFPSAVPGGAFDGVGWGGQGAVPNQPAQGGTAGSQVLGSPGLAHDASPYTQEVQHAQQQQQLLLQTQGESGGVAGGGSGAGPAAVGAGFYAYEGGGGGGGEAALQDSHAGSAYGDVAGPSMQYTSQYAWSSTPQHQLEGMQPFHDGGAGTGHYGGFEQQQYGSAAAQYSSTGAAAASQYPFVPPALAAASAPVAQHEAFLSTTTAQGQFGGHWDGTAAQGQSTTPGAGNPPYSMTSVYGGYQYDGSYQ